jgi:hypothetical protein
MSDRDIDVLSKEEYRRFIELLDSHPCYALYYLVDVLAYHTDDLRLPVLPDNDTPNPST